jgi:hypothetical protein
MLKECKEGDKQPKMLFWGKKGTKQHFGAN